MRKKLGLTQDAMARHAGFSSGYLRQVEGGYLNLSLRSLDHLAERLGCAPIDLLKTSSLKKQKPGRPKMGKPGRSKPRL